MNEPIKAKPESPKRSKRKPAMEPLGWDEIVSQPGMGGYLSFLNGPIPLPHLQSNSEVASSPGVVSNTAPASSATETVTDPGIDSTTEIDSNPGPLIAAGSARATGTEITPETYISPGPDAIYNVIAPVVESRSGLETDAGLTHTGPGVESNPGIGLVHRVRIRKCAATHDGHSLGEEVLYQALWKAAAAGSAESRTIVIGWRGMSQLCRMTPKNCKINTQRLIRKLALEVLSPYNTPESIGTTYRVFSEDAILRRRRGAGLEWVIRSRGVEFVNPKTGGSISAHPCAYVSE